MRSETAMRLRQVGPSATMSSQIHMTLISRPVITLIQRVSCRRSVSGQFAAFALPTARRRRDDGLRTLDHCLIDELHPEACHQRLDQLSIRHSHDGNSPLGPIERQHQDRQWCIFEYRDGVRAVAYRRRCCPAWIPRERKLPARRQICLPTWMRLFRVLLGESGGFLQSPR